MEHPFHDDTGNFGSTNFASDRVFGTLYRRGERLVKNPTVFNLGYTDVIAARHPWGARRSHPRPARPRVVDRTARQSPDGG